MGEEVLEAGTLTVVTSATGEICTKKFPVVSAVERDPLSFDIAVTFNVTEPLK